jgi:DNA-binding CsgD family transcriptional regulator/tetratricopeptide (TPR) repeat protein
LAGGTVSRLTTRVASHRLIGRSAELAELEAALAEAADGHPSLAFVAGESGVGKTRLLTELMRSARDGGALVLAGDSVDFGGESEMPYQPLVAAFRPLARGTEPALPDRVRDAVAPLLPGLGGPQPAADHAGQARLFEGLLSLLDILGQERPVLLVIEDLHWADRSTRAALAFLASSLTSERVLLVASYRSDELHRSHPLRSLLAELELDPRSRRVPLAPLTRDELAEQLTDILGDPPDADLLERLWTRSGGNPLFGEELLAAGLDGRGAAPDTLRDALMLRVERLSEPARELLWRVAVGQRLDHALLEETSGLESRVLRDALREAIDGHILVVQDDGMYRFRHALLREVVEQELLPGERSELHLTLARALEHRLDENADAQITAAVAYHFAASGDEPAALAAAVRAATAAERVHAHDEVAALLDRALELWDRVPDPEARAGADRVSVLTRAADAAGAIGDPGRQLELLEAAFAGLGPEPDPRRAAPILESTARAQRHLNRAKSGIATLERALDLVEAGGDPQARASLLAGLARARMIVAHFGHAVRAAREALELAAGADMPLIEGHARNTLGFSLAMTGEVEEGAAELREAIRIARGRDNLADLGEAYVNYADMLHILGRSDDARAVAAEGRQAVAGRRPVSMLWLDMKIAEIAFDVGEWEAAEAILPTPQRWTGTQSRVGIELRRAALAVGRGERAAAAALLRELEPLAADSSEPQVLGPLGVVAAEVRRREGDLDGARAAVDQGLERIAFCTDDALGVSALAAAGVIVEADAAERARDLGDAEAESAALRRADDLLARVEAAATETRPVERAALLGARAEAGRAAGRPDPAEYARAAAAWDEVGRPEPAARMRWGEAEVHAATGDREAAAEPARAAHATATRLGAGWLRGEIESLATRARLTLEPVQDEAAAPEEDSFGLTSRERQVLALIAEGATNREIGSTLFMAEKTASVHVSRILTKLNARTRTEAAAVAHRHRLAEPGDT